MSKNRQRELQLAAITHRGRVRERNEDALSVCGAVFTGTMQEPVARVVAEPQILLLADGMGGHAQGDVASRTVLKVLIDRGSQSIVPLDWVDALHTANHRLYDLMGEDLHALGLGTTVAGVVISRSGVITFNVGDSRVYHHGQRGLVCLSEDDVPLGTGSHRTRRIAHQITQSLGGRLARTEILPHITEVPALEGGESLLLCSDGLTDMLQECEIAQVLSDTADPSRRVICLLNLALNAGGLDNISIIVVRAI